MRLSKHVRWFVVFTLLLSIALLTSCKNGKSKSPTAPAGGGGTNAAATCELADTCPNGGWLKSCVTDDLTAYYLTSDGNTFQCTGAGANLDCVDAAWQAGEHCYFNL
jgi:hypothetical protein